MNMFEPMMTFMEKFKPMKFCLNARAQARASWFFSSAVDRSESAWCLGDDGIQVVSHVSSCKLQDFTFSFCCKFVTQHDTAPLALSAM